MQPFANKTFRENEHYHTPPFCEDISSKDNINVELQEVVHKEDFLS